MLGHLEKFFEVIKNQALLDAFPGQLFHMFSELLKIRCYFWVVFRCLSQKLFGSNHQAYMKVEKQISN